MAKDYNSDFAMERCLREMDPALHRNFSNAVFGLQNLLSSYKHLFPDFTDHTELHSLTVIDFCNRLIGHQIERMNADEIYALLMGCYFHDVGMGISQRDYDAFSKLIPFGDYFKTHDPADLPRVIRDYHNEFSGYFLRKYSEFFEIPSQAHLHAIIQIARGHRKTLLTDEAEYPLALPMPNGNTVCLPYLSALIRLADEIDVAAARNSVLLYDIASIEDSYEVMFHKTVKDVRQLIISEKAFTMVVDTDEQEVFDEIVRIRSKMQSTLDDCREAVLGRTPYVITQERVDILPVGKIRSL